MSIVTLNTEKNSLLKKRWVHFAIFVVLGVVIGFLFYRPQMTEAPPPKVVQQEMVAAPSLPPQKTNTQKTLRHNSTASEQNPEKTQNNQILRVTGDPNVDRTIHLIKVGGPFPYPHKDGSVFQNREGHLPKQKYGYYHEYTVPTPGMRTRGPRRIVTGGNPPIKFYYTTDHYNSFKTLQISP